MKRSNCSWSSGKGIESNGWFHSTLDTQHGTYSHTLPPTTDFSRCKSFLPHGWEHTMSTPCLLFRPSLSLPSMSTCCTVYLPEGSSNVPGKHRHCWLQHDSPLRKSSSKPEERASRRLPTAMLWFSIAELQQIVKWEHYRKMGRELLSLIFFYLFISLCFSLPVCHCACTEVGSGYKLVTERTRKWVKVKILH